MVKILKTEPDTTLQCAPPQNKTRVEKMNRGAFEVGNVASLNGLTGSLFGQGVQYAMGGDFTLNVLNAGIFTNGYANIGLLELHLGGEGGAKMRVGSGGADVSVGTLYSAAQGAAVLGTNFRINKYINSSASGDFDSKISLRALSKYGYGDAEQNTLFENLLSGKDKIDTSGKDDGAFAETTRKGDGRTISLNNYRTGMGYEDQMLLGIVLGHEAYRDGIVTADNSLETQRAVLGHTKMAMSMINGGEKFTLTSGLINDLIAYSSGTAGFNSYVDGRYDSSADYWKLIFKDDNTASLINDGRKSLFIDTKDEGEFKLWDLENEATIGGALSMITGKRNPDLTNLTLSGETVKRLGMYSILNANGLFGTNGPLTADTFNQLANNSTYTPGLGYYLDFKSIGLDWEKTISTGGVVITSDFTASFSPPTKTHDIPWRPFTGDAVKDFIVYGVAEQAGLHINTGQPNGREYRAETEDGNRAVGWAQLSNDLSSQPLDLGVKNSKYGINEYEKSKRLDVSIPGFSSVQDKALPVGGVGVIVGQLGVGAANAVTKDRSRVSTWDTDFGKFYTIETASSIQNFRNNTITYTFTYKSPADNDFNYYVKQAQKWVK